MSSTFTARKSVLAASIAAVVATNMAVAQTDSAKSRVLEEVTVTATKRESSVQDLAVSVAAVSGDQLRELKIDSLLSLDKAIPGMQVNNKGNDPIIIMRGAGAAGVNDIAVPVYIDGLYRPRAGQALASFLDLERVEVLRGPQGTLFGRNTLGGLMNMITVKPDTEETDFGAAVTVGDYDYQRVEGFVNLPLGDKVAMRLTASDTQQDPFVENTFRSDGGLKDEDNTYARLQVSFTPSDTFDVTFSATYWEDTANGNSDYAYKVLGIPVNPATGATNGISGVMQPRQGVHQDPFYGGGKEFTGIYPIHPTASTIKDPFKISADFKPMRDIEETSFSALVNWDVGFADLKANIGIFDYEEYRLTDSDLSANPTAYADTEEYNGYCVDYSFAGDSPDGPWWYWDATTQQRCGLAAGQRVQSEAVQADINLTSKGDGDLQWTVGYFYYDDSDEGDTNGEFVYGYTTSATPQSPRWAHWLSQGAGGTKSQAIYGQAEYSLTDQFRVTAGLRYSEDERNLYSGSLIDESRTEAWPRFTVDPSSQNEGDDDNTDYRLAAQYDLNDDMMVYASISTGYISGEPIRQGSTELSDPNEVDAYEIGLKSSLLDGSMTLNAAIYQNDFEGLSTTIFVPQGGTIIAETAPGGSMTARGLEVDMTWRATEALLVTAGLALDDSELDKFSEGESRFSEGGDITDAGGNRAYILDGKKPRFSPDYTLNLGLSYDMDLGEAGMLTPGAFIYHTDDYKTQNVEYFFAEQDSYTTVDLRVTWVDVNQQWNVQGYVKNATDEEYLTETTVFSGARAFGDYGNPRTYGVRLGYNF